MAITKCAFEGCRETTEQPDKDGWTYFADVKPFSHGLYCHAHAHVLEQVLLEGGFENPENDLDGDDEAR